MGDNKKITNFVPMKYFVQSVYILGFWALGSGVSFMIGGVIPGSILGMIFLFIALACGFIRADRVENVSALLIRFMVLFFLPAAVGVMTVWDLIIQNLWAIVLATVVSTVLIIGTVGVVQQKLGRKW